MTEKDDIEYWLKLVEKDKKLSFLSNSIKHGIAYFDWTAYCGYEDSKRPISRIVKKVLKKSREANTKRR